MRFDTHEINYDDFEQSTKAAQLADSLEAQLIPRYPEGTIITSAEDVHEAALQIDILKSLVAYQYDRGNWVQATAHDDLQDGADFEFDKGNEYAKQIGQIMVNIPDQPR